MVGVGALDAPYICAIKVFSNVEFSDTSSVPKTLFVLFINGTPRVSLRLGRAHVLTTHCVVIHYARVATLRLSLQSIKVTPKAQFLPKPSLH